MSIREKIRKIRYSVLIVWGILLGAAGTAGVKSSWHVIPKWTIVAVVVWGIIVILIWMISGKQSKQVKIIENNSGNLAQNFSSEISIISKAVDEPMEMEFWGKQGGINRFKVISISGKNIVNDHILLISFDGAKVKDVSLDAAVIGKEHSEYFGKIEMFYCKRQQGISGGEKLKTEKYYKEIFSKKQWESETKKINILNVMNNISFEK